SLECHEATIRPHYVRSRDDVDGVQRPSQAAKMSTKWLAHVRIDGCRAGALIFPKLTRYIRGQSNVYTGNNRLDDCLGSPFIFWVNIGVYETDDDAVDRQFFEANTELFQLRFI